MCNVPSLRKTNGLDALPWYTTWTGKSDPLSDAAKVAVICHLSSTLDTSTRFNLYSAMVHSLTGTYLIPVYNKLIWNLFTLPQP